MNVPVENFQEAGLDEQFAAVEQAVEAYRDGSTSNVAVVAEPFAGRGALLDYGEELLDVESVVRHGFTEPVTDGLPAFEEADAYVIDDCHYLYRRAVGGFDAVEAFVQRMARSDSLFLTSWNRYAWQYLTAVRDLDRVFPEVIHVPDFDADQFGEVVDSLFGPDLPDYVEDGAEGRIKSFEWVRYPVSFWNGYRIGVPVLKPNPEYIRSWASPSTEKSTEAVVLEKVQRAAGGNVGVAVDLWVRSVRDDEIATGHVDVLEPEFDLDDDGALVLQVVVSMESVPRSTLEDVLAEEPVDAIVQHLAEEGVVVLGDDEVRLTPRGLRPAVAELRRRRLLW